MVVPPQVASYAIRIVLATQPEHELSLPRVRQYVRYGAGPRGAQALILAGKAMALTSGRFNVSMDDIQRLTGPALRHRIALNFDGQCEGVQIDQLLEEIIKEPPKDKNRPECLKN